MQPHSVATDTWCQHVVLDLLDGQKEQQYPDDRGKGMNNATTTAGITDKMGPNIGTSSNSPADTPRTTA